jgi:hypothetical protein
MSPELGRTGFWRLKAVGLCSRGWVEDEKRLSLPSSRIVPYKKARVDVFPKTDSNYQRGSFSFTVLGKSGIFY